MMIRSYTTSRIFLFVGEGGGQKLNNGMAQEVDTEYSSKNYLTRFVAKSYAWMICIMYIDLMFFKRSVLRSSITVAISMAVFAGLLFELFHSTSPVTPPLQHRRSLVQNQSLAIPPVLWRATALLSVLHLIQHQIRFAGLQLQNK